jgi:hypothetical protein
VSSRKRFSLNPPERNLLPFLVVYAKPTPERLPDTKGSRHLTLAENELKRPD